MKKEKHIPMQVHRLRIRLCLFLFGCIGSRLLFTLCSAYATGWTLFGMGIIACIPVMGWWFIMWVAPRDKGIETLYEPIWWQSLRPFHALLWGSFAYAAMMGFPSAWKILLLDTGLGACSFLIHHAQTGNLYRMVKDL
jgi:hypothetical protein